MRRRLASETVFAGRVVRLRVDTVELPDGRQTSREVVEHPGAAAIVPLDADGRVHLVRQYRDAVGEELLEIPAGKLKPGEEPADCAIRELREETGLEAGRIELLASIYSTPGFSDEVIHLFLAEELAEKGTDHESEEFITSETRALEPVAELLGELSDAKTIAGILIVSAVLGRRGTG